VIFQLEQTTDIQTLSAYFVYFESSGNSLKALSVKACKPWVNTNASMPAAQQLSACFQK
jgi:hypothetical protein